MAVEEEKNQQNPITPEQVLEQLRALRQQIPEFVQLERGQARQLRRHANVDATFAHEAISAIGASEVMQTAVGNTAGELHRAEDELARWTAVESEFRSMLRGVVAANLIRRQRLGRTALQAYNIGRSLARQEEHASLRPHVERMSQIRRFNRRRSRPAAAPELNAAPPTQQQ